MTSVGEGLSSKSRGEEETSQETILLVLCYMHFLCCTFCIYSFINYCGSVLHFVPPFLSQEFGGCLGVKSIHFGCFWGVLSSRQTISVHRTWTSVLLPGPRLCTNWTIPFTWIGCGMSSHKWFGFFFSVRHAMSSCDNASLCCGVWLHGVSMGSPKVASVTTKQLDNFFCC